MGLVYFSNGLDHPRDVHSIRNAPRLLKLVKLWDGSLGLGRYSHVVCAQQTQTSTNMLDPNKHKPH